MTKKEEVRYKALEKKRHIIFFAAILLLLGFIMIVIGTYAYYRTTITGTVSGTIATWFFEANDSSTTFSTITLAPTQTTKTLNSTLAPGTSGSFDIELNSTGSLVPVLYTITFSNFTNLPANLHFYSDEDFTNITDITASGYRIEGELASDSTLTKTIYWKWDFGDANSESADSQDANKSVSFVVNIVGKQKNQ